jgi:hypothetical protein
MRLSGRIIGKGGDPLAGVAWSVAKVHEQHHQTRDRNAGVSPTPAGRLPSCSSQMHWPIHSGSRSSAVLVDPNHANRNALTISASATDSVVIHRQCGDYVID